MELERSVLEKKSRDELQSIAEKLGGKPGSRARKAQIVDVILELAGVGGGGADTTGDSGSVDLKSGSESDAEDAGTTDGEAGATSSVGSDEGGDRANSGSTRSRIRKLDKETSTPSSKTDSGDTKSGDEPASEDSKSDSSGDGDRSGRGRSRDSGGDRGGQARSQGSGGGRSGGDGASKSDRTRNDSAKSEGGRSEERNDGGSRNDGGGRNRKGGRNDQRNDGQRNEGQRSGRGGGNDRGGNDRGGNDQSGNDQSASEDVESGNRRRRRRQRGRDDEPFTGEPTPVAGYLDLRDEGYGFLRVAGFLPSANDCYVSVKQVRQFGLRKGDHLAGGARPASRNEKNPALLNIEQVNGEEPSSGKDRRNFAELTPLFPDKPLKMERLGSSLDDMTTRIIDLISPIGMGQRGLIVSPPKAGKTTIMKQIARSIEVNNPDVELIVLLIDERPEEVTDMARHLKSGMVASSTFDRPPEEHTQVAELVLERAKRLVEDGKDVALIVDGITRLSRAYNLSAPGTGRLLSGGVDAGALYPPKRFFGAARNIEEGGSLTILATALVDTGSRMDEVIFEEFKGTGNMELRLDRRLAEKRLFPAIDLLGSSTRHDELLMDQKQLTQVGKLRRVLDGLNEDGSTAAGLDMLIDRLKTFKTNDDFLAELAKS